MVRRIEGFTFIEITVVLVIVSILTAIAITSLVNEKKTYNSLTDTTKINTILNYARFMSVKNSSRYIAQLNPTDAVVMSIGGAVVKSMPLNSGCVYKINNTVFKTLNITFNQYGIPFNKGNIMNSISVCDESNEKCKEIDFVNTLPTK